MVYYVKLLLYLDFGAPILHKNHVLKVCSKLFYPLKLIFDHQNDISKCFFP